MGFPGLPIEPPRITEAVAILFSEIASRIGLRDCCGEGRPIHRAGSRIGVWAGYQPLHADGCRLVAFRWWFEGSDSRACGDFRYPVFRPDLRARQRLKGRSPWSGHGAALEQMPFSSHGRKGSGRGRCSVRGARRRPIVRRCGRRSGGSPAREACHSPRISSRRGASRRGPRPGARWSAGPDRPFSAMGGRSGRRRRRAAGGPWQGGACASQQPAGDPRL